MESIITREAAWELLRKYNKDPFHLQHALTVEGVMRWYAEQLALDEVLQKTLDAMRDCETRVASEMEGILYLCQRSETRQTAVNYCKEHGYKWY